MIGVAKSLQKYNLKNGDVAAILKDKNEIVRFYPIENRLFDVEVSSLKIMKYKFSSKPNDLLLYDMDYIILVFKNSEFALFRFGGQGFQRTTNGEIYDDTDIT